MIRAIPKRRRYLGSWTLPSGNSCNVYLSCEEVRRAWDVPPSPAWPADDFTHWYAVTFAEITRAIAIATGGRVLGIDVTDAPENVRVVTARPGGIVSRPNRKRP